MRAADDLIKRAMRLPPSQRRRVVDALLAPPVRPRRRRGRYAALLALAGTAHSDHTGVSADKYPHVAAAASDRRRA